jgi:hypothetical protein
MHLVVAENFHVKSVAHPPNKADTPLIINPNAVLTFAISVQSLKAISGRRSQIPELNCTINLAKLSLRDALNCLESFAVQAPV